MTYYSDALLTFYTPAAALLEWAREAQARHVEWTDEDVGSMGLCKQCEEPFPCDAAQLASVVKTLVEALEWYADDSNWTAVDPLPNSVAEQDEGARAKAALTRAAGGSDE